jgi:glycosyltransferase involved in cell wall biosynthesis
VSNTFVLTPQSPSQDYRRRLGTADVFTLPELRRLPLTGLLRLLAAQRGRACVIAFEDPSSQALLPVLHALAVAARPASVTVVDEAGGERPLPARQLPAGVWRLAATSAANLVAGMRAQRGLRALLEEPRVDARVRGTGRVAYVNANLWFGVKAGGSVGHVAGVVNGLSASGLDVDLYSATEPVMIDAGVRVVPLAAPQLLGIPYELNFPHFQHEVVRTVIKNDGQYDFVYQRLSMATFAGAQIARRLAVPLVLEYNGSEVWVARNWGRPLRREQYALEAEAASLRHATLVVTVSRVLRDELVGRGVEPDRIVWYPNCVDEHVYDPDRFDAEARRRLRGRYDIAPDDVVVEFVGTFGRWHGVDILARAIARLSHDDPDWLARRRVRFLLVGDGLRMTEVREILRNVDPRLVVIPGLVPQADGPVHLAAADVLVSPHVPNDDESPFFGSPTKLFEYMALGKGIVASGLDQIAEVLAASVDAVDLPDGPPAADEGRLAVLATPGSVDELVAGIRFLVDEAAWRERLGANARRKAVAKYTWSRHVQVILDGLAEVTK